jgi:hypothetical protein
MRFLVYCPVDSADLRAALGTAEYSYHFVKEGFLPVLERLGEVITVTDPQREADVLHAEAAARGQDCRLLCFCPPNLAPVGLTCPTTVVLAWEFETIPSEGWNDDPRNDWRTVLADHGNLITLSRHSADVVREAMGSEFPVTAIPVPVYDRMTAPVHPGRKPPSGESRITVEGRVVDSRDVIIGANRVGLRDPLVFRTHDWDGGPLEIRFDQHSAGRGYLMGFYAPEDWGTWARAAEPWVVLPFSLQGRLRLSLLATGYGRNVGRTVSLVLGDVSHEITLAAEPVNYMFTVNLRRPTNVIAIKGLDARAANGSIDPRTLSIGLCSLSVTKRRGPAGLLRRHRQAGTLIRRAESATTTMELSGVVYTTVLNPTDGRKNWEDILSAFAYALRDHDDATLVLKMTHHSLSTFLADFVSNLLVIGEIKCRVVVVHSFLTGEQFRQLRDATTYYVNASRGEGLCLPLMEFMSAGVPAIAPAHTAMADYVDQESTFVVGAALQPTVWPNDPALMIRTLYHRIDWQSLVDQFRASYEVAKSDPEAYQQRSAAASRAIELFSCDDAVAVKLADHFERVAP